MKHTFLRPWTMALGMLALTPLYAQVSTGFNFGTATDFVGWDNTMTNDPLQIKHEANQPIQWFTSNLQRMQLNPTQNSTINGFVVPTSGFLGLGQAPLVGTAPGRAWSRLHLHDVLSGGGVVQFGFRPWMRNGLTLTGHGDQMYVGHRYGAGATDPTDAVIQWSDNSGTQQGPDLMRFLFTGSYTSATTGEGSLIGREIMRLHPEGNVGLGDWQAANVLGTAQQPVERLDILDGTIQLRRLIPDYQNNALNWVVVADSHGRLHWRDATTIGGGAQCTWLLNGNDDVTTAWDGFGCPPQGINNVGVGVDFPEAKLHVKDGNDNGFPIEIAVRAEARSGANENAGVDAYAGGGSKSFGVMARATQANDSNIAVTGRAYAMNGAMAIGVHGFADGNTQVDPIGVYGEAVNSLSGGSTWAGWFEGDVMINGVGTITSGTWLPSDSTLKTNIQDLSNASSMINALQAKTYEYLIADHPNLALPAGGQAGLLAQQVELVFPDLVRQTRIPAMRDSIGNVVVPAEDIKTINYVGLIPYLIAANQEQALRLSDQDTRLVQLEQRLNDCCTAQEVDLTPRSMQDGTGTLENDLFRADTRLTIAPNPFQEQTTISYTLEGNARVQLQVSNQGGLHIATLRDQQQEEGAYSLTWHTADLAPGTYIVTLFSDGAPVVKRAVKVR